MNTRYMENPRKIDRSFKERLDVLHLLEKLKKENITYAEMDEIGGQLNKVGRSAVQPLLRRIWREQSCMLISKYTYLLDFLDDRYWLDQIIQIALKRRDLGLEAKSAIMATLDESGIDISIPPFSILFAGSSESLAKSFSQYMDKGEEGLLWLLEEFSFLTEESKRSILEELSRIRDPRLLEFFSLLFWYDDENIVTDVIRATGQVRNSAAVALLREFRNHADPSLFQQIDKSLRRLAFVGIKDDNSRHTSNPSPFHSAYASPVDGGGYRQLWLARYRKDGGLDTIELQIHDISGINRVWGDTGESVDTYEERTGRRSQEELVEPIDHAYALQLLCDGIFRNKKEKSPFPPEFLLRRKIFSPEELIPASYDPPCAGGDLKMSSRLLARSAELFEEEFFAGWYQESCLVYEMAEEWMRLEKSSSQEQLATGLERLIKTVCNEEFQPQLETISRRLFLNADFLARIGIDGEIVKAVQSAADSLRQFPLPCHLHPFLRRFAMESLIVARESMEEGYDLRDLSDESDWE